jgi:hypothetical protein
MVTKMAKKAKEDEMINEQEQAEAEAQEAKSEADAVAEAIQNAFSLGQAEGLTDDQIKYNMIGAGATFKNVTRLFNELLVEAGLAEDKGTRDEKIAAILKDADVSTEDGFNAAVQQIMEDCVGVLEKSAAGSVRAYCKKHSKEFWTKPKAEGPTRESFIGRYYAWLIENPTVSEEECHKFLFGKDGYPETSDNVKSYERMHQNVRKLVNDVAAKIGL